MIVEITFTSLRRTTLRLIRIDTGFEIQVTDGEKGIAKAGHFQSYPKELVDALKASLVGATDSVIGSKVFPFGVRVHSNSGSNEVVLFFGQHKQIVQLALRKTDVRLIVFFIDTYLAQ